VRILLRWSHFVAGVVWIGMLYFFNLVNVPLMKKLDGPTKKIVVPELMPRSLWYFRWGAVATVLAGLGYFAMYILKSNAHNANASAWAWLGIWLAVVLVLYAILYAVLQNINNGTVIAVIVAVLVLALACSVIYLFPKADNKMFSIGTGGGLGMWMLLNVWGIIWPAQKRIIAATAAGTPPPADLPRKAFLASRTNAWLSLPMLFFMGTSHGDYIILGSK
jgi:uncharacterized membrane protein